jgi:hypothetical protein
MKKQNSLRHPQNVRKASRQPWLPCLPVLLEQMHQSIFALARLLTAGLLKLLTWRMTGRLYLLCFRNRFRATMTGTELLVTK